MTSAPTARARPGFVEIGYLHDQLHAGVVHKRGQPFRGSGRDREGDRRCPGARRLGFTDALGHAGGATHRSPELRRNLYAATSTAGHHRPLTAASTSGDRMVVSGTSSRTMSPRQAAPGARRSLTWIFVPRMLLPGG